MKARHNGNTDVSKTFSLALYTDSNREFRQYLDSIYRHLYKI